MLKRIMQLVATALLLSIMLSANVWADPVFTLSPLSGAISGAPGTTIGWGYAIYNDSNYLLVTSANFCEGSLFCNGSPQAIFPLFGTWNDFVGPSFLVVAPLTSVSQSFDVGLLTGAGSFDIDSGATPGSSLEGMIWLSYDLFSVSPNDPSFDPENDLISNGNLLSADASVTIEQGSNPPAVPEPSTLLLLSTGLAGAGIFVRRRQA